MCKKSFCVKSLWVKSIWVKSICKNSFWVKSLWVKSLWVKSTWKKNFWVKSLCNKSVLGEESMGEKYMGLCLTVCLPACLSVRLSYLCVCQCLSVFLFVLDSFCQSVCLSVSLFAWLAAWLFVFVFVFYLPVCFAACLSLCLASQLSAVCLSVFLPRCLCCQCALSGVWNSRSRARVPQEKRTPAQVRNVDFCKAAPDGSSKRDLHRSEHSLGLLCRHGKIFDLLLALWNPLAGQKEVRSTFQTMQLMTRIKFEFNSCLKVKWRTDTLELNSNWILLYIRFQAFFESEFHAHL